MWELSVEIAEGVRCAMRIVIGGFGVFLGICAAGWGAQIAVRGEMWGNLLIFAGIVGAGMSAMAMAKQ